MARKRGGFQSGDRITLGNGDRLTVVGVRGTGRATRVWVHNHALKHHPTQVVKPADLRRWAITITDRGGKAVYDATKDPRRLPKTLQD
jgi:hypothetical protein